MDAIDGRYRVSKRLSQGSFGEVLEATDEQTRQTVVIKLIRSDRLLTEPSRNRELICRFEREIAILARLDHPNIIKILSWGVHQDLPYYVMESARDAMSLREFVASHPPKPLDAVRITLQVAHALLYADQKGIVHRDVKLDNILVQRDKKVKLIDFGLAKSYYGPNGRLIDDPNGFRSEAEVIIGCRETLSPEQIRACEDIDGRADVFAMGVVFESLIKGSAISNVRSSCSSDVQSLIRQMQRLDRDERIPITDVVAALNRIGDSLAKAVPSPQESRYPELAETAIWSPGAGRLLQEGSRS